jgi:hypothetical protein
MAESSKVPVNGETCRCGWLLPLGVVAFPLGSNTTRDNWISDAFVALNCPCCGCGHSFFNSEVAAAVVAACEDMARGGMFVRGPPGNWKKEKN